VVKMHLSVSLFLLLSSIAYAQVQLDLASFADMPFADNRRKVPPLQTKTLESIYESLGQPIRTETTKYWKSDDPKDRQVTLEYPDMVLIYLFIDAQKQYWRIVWQLRIRDMNLVQRFHYGMTDAEILSRLGEPTWSSSHNGGKELLYDTASGNNVSFYFEKGRLLYINITAGM
jgi:hypothetical protein